MVDDFTGQKAPSATRRIKTRATRTRACTSDSSQKAPSAKRCIKTSFLAPALILELMLSESTERQKVH